MDGALENLHRLATGGYDCAVAIRCQAVDSSLENLHRLATGGYVRLATGGYVRGIVAIRCQAVDGGARKASTIWRQVATFEES